MDEGNRGQLLATVTGKPATASLGTVAPSMFGETTLHLFENRIVETTKKIVEGRDSEILVTQIDSAEISIKGNPLWIVLGVVTLGFFGIGVLFFVLYFVFKHKFLIVRSKSNAQIVGITGDETQYRNFMEALLVRAEQHKGPLPERSI